MSYSIPKMAIVVAGAFALSGCGAISSIFGSHSARMPEVRVPAADAESAIVQATQEGRNHLDKGQTGLAIESFQRALSLGAPTPDALNGMGVAFARLGRYEVAHRFFEDARALDPSNERYAANLARLNRSPAFAMRHEADMVAAVTEAAAREEKAAAAAVASAKPRPGQLTRVSKHEFKINTATPTKAPLIKNAGSDSRFKPVVRIEFGKPGSLAASASGKAVVSNPHLVEKARAASGFEPLVRLTFAKSRPAGRDD